MVSGIQERARERLSEKASFSLFKYPRSLPRLKISERSRVEETVSCRRPRFRIPHPGEKKRDLLD